MLLYGATLARHGAGRRSVVAITAIAARVDITGQAVQPIASTAFGGTGVTSVVVSKFAVIGQSATNAIAQVDRTTFGGARAGANASHFANRRVPVAGLVARPANALDARVGVRTDIARLDSVESIALIAIRPSFAIERGGAVETRAAFGAIGTGRVKRPVTARRDYVAGTAGVTFRALTLAAEAVASGGRDSSGTRASTVTANVSCSRGVEVEVDVTFSALGIVSSGASDGHGAVVNDRALLAGTPVVTHPRRRAKV